MTKCEQMLRMVGKDLFVITDMALRYGIAIPKELEEFMFDWYELDAYKPVLYDFNELKELANITFTIVDNTPSIINESMVKFYLEDLRNKIAV